MPIYSKAIIDTLLKLKQEGKILSIGTSIHDRKRAGRLALNSEIDLLKKIAMPPWPGKESFNGPPLTPELCYRFVLTNQHVHIELTGPQNLTDLVSRILENYQAGEIDRLRSEVLSILDAGIY